MLKECLRLRWGFTTQREMRTLKKKQMKKNRKGHNNNNSNNNNNKFKVSLKLKKYMSQFCSVISTDVTI